MLLNFPKLILSILILSTIYLNSCQPNSSPTNNTNQSNSSNNQTPESEKKIKITLYQSDNLCEKYITKIVEFPEKESLEKTIALILDQNNSSDFNIVGYRFQVDEKTRIATIDFRIDPNSKRQLISLSSCEQFILLGSLKQTLLNNPQWQIKDLKFLQQGKDIFNS